MKLAMLIAAVDPAVGGVLVFGDRGSGKSTAVRGLSGLLPPMRVVVGCRYNCDPDTPAVFCEDCRTRAAAGPLKHHKVPVPGRRPAARGDGRSRGSAPSISNGR